MIEAEEKETKAKQKTADVNRRLEQALSALQELGQENQNIQVPGNEHIPKTTNRRHFRLRIFDRAVKGVVLRIKKFRVRSTRET